MKTDANLKKKSFQDGENGDEQFEWFVIESITQSVLNSLQKKPVIHELWKVWG